MFSRKKLQKFDEGVTESSEKFMCTWRETIGKNKRISQKQTLTIRLNLFIYVRENMCILRISSLEAHPVISVPQKNVVFVDRVIDNRTCALRRTCGRHRQICNRRSVRQKLHEILWFVRLTYASFCTCIENLIGGTAFSNVRERRKRNVVVNKRFVALIFVGSTMNGYQDALLARLLVKRFKTGRHLRTHFVTFRKSHQYLTHFSTTLYLNRRMAGVSYNRLRKWNWIVRSWLHRAASTQLPRDEIALFTS